MESAVALLAVVTEGARLMLHHFELFFHSPMLGSKPMLKHTLALKGFCPDVTFTFAHILLAKEVTWPHLTLSGWEVKFYHEPKRRKFKILFLP